MRPPFPWQNGTKYPFFVINKIEDKKQVKLSTGHEQGRKEQQTFPFCLKSLEDKNQKKKRWERESFTHRYKSTSIAGGVRQSSRLTQTWGHKLDVKAERQPDKLFSSLCLHTKIVKKKNNFVLEMSHLTSINLIKYEMENRSRRKQTKTKRKPKMFWIMKTTFFCYRTR